MAEMISFETPENVQVSYQPAGLGSRFIAWFTDVLLLGVMMILIALALLILGTVGGSLFQPLSGHLGHQGSPFPLYLIGFFIIIVGFCTFFYFGLSELFLHGQTIGKRQVKIRVVKANGFTLDAGSILLRNVFRILDQIPVMWIVPFLSSHSQRLGDMVAGTIVVAESKEALSDLRQSLLRISAAESLFHFDAAALARLRASDVAALEKILDRWHTLSESEKERFAADLSEPLAGRMGLEPPAREERPRFLRELLAAEYRRQYRNLG